MAKAAELTLDTARAYHTLGRVLGERQEHLAAIERYREASALYDTCEALVKRWRVRIQRR